METRHIHLSMIAAAALAMMLLGGCGSTSSDGADGQIDDQRVEELVGPAAAVLAGFVDRPELGDLEDCPLTSVETVIATAPSSVQMSEVELVQSIVTIESAPPSFDAVRCNFDTSLGRLEFGAFPTVAGAQASIFCMGMRSGNMTSYLGVDGPLYSFYLPGGQNQCGMSAEQERAGVLWEVADGLVLVIVPPFGTNDRESAELLEEWIDALGRDAVQRLANGGAPIETE